MMRRLFAIFLGLGASWTAIPAHAGDCAAREQVVTRLEAQYSEKLAAGGLQSSDVSADSITNLVEVWVSPENGTFTVTSTSATGVACILATGTDWFAAQKQTQILPQGVAS